MHFVIRGLVWLGDLFFFPVWKLFPPEAVWESVLCVLLQAAQLANGQSSCQCDAAKNGPTKTTVILGRNGTRAQDLWVKLSHTNVYLPVFFDVSPICVKQSYFWIQGGC